MINLRIDDSLAKEYYDEFFKPLVEDKLIAYHKATRINTELRNFVKYLADEGKNIAIGRPEKLEEIRKYIIRHYPKAVKELAVKRSPFRTKLLAIFNYDHDHKGFGKISDFDKWGAYRLLQKLNINCCPYCNRQYIHTHQGDLARKATKGKKSKQKTRGTLDHFFPQGKYPYFALSFNNLIPSCYSCNSLLKNRFEFTYDDFLHPYDQGFDGLLRFNVKHSGNATSFLDIFNGDPNTLEIELVRLRAADEGLADKAENNADIFQLKDLYNFHRDHVSELLLKARLCTPENITGLFNTIPGLFKSEDEVRRLLGGYTETDKFVTRPLDKLTHDVAEQFGIKP